MKEEHAQYGESARLSVAAVAGAICVVLFAAVMLWWLVDPDLSDDWFSAPSQWKECFDRYIKPLAFADLIAATCLGWIAVRKIQRSSGRQHGLALAVFDG